MQLAELVRRCGAAVPQGNLSVDVNDITHDSRSVVPGAVFACMRGEIHDGHSFAPDAVAAGALALVVDHRLNTSVPEIVVPDVRRSLGPMASIVHGRPSTRLAVVGVTGTSGKTTVAHLLGAIMEAAGRKNLVLGTLSGQHTTEEGSDLQRRLANALADGTKAVAMEVSSHALALHRVDGTQFAVAIFTNLGCDHLDFHGDLESYFLAKSHLFRSSTTNVGVVHRDDEWGRRLIEDPDPKRCAIRTYGADDAADVTLTSSGSTFAWRGCSMHVRLPGRFNVLNAIAAATAAAELGIEPAVIAEGLDSLRGVRGRFESVRSDPPVSGHPDDVDVVVDYAHEPDALAAVLRASREITLGRLIVVFGAGGDRDRSKRPIMGQTAVELADAVIVTSDNPRSEDPQRIVDEIIGGVDDLSNVTIELDRAAAIETAVAEARPGDLIVIAGKGHETTQTIGTDVIDFDDVSQARDALEQRRRRQ